MSDWSARVVLALLAQLAAAASAMAQAVAPAIMGNAMAGNMWPVVIANGVVALLGLCWLLLMRRRRG